MNDLNKRIADALNNLLNGNLLQRTKHPKIADAL